MRWLDHLRSDPEAANSLLAFLDDQIAQAHDHFLRAQNFEGISKVQGRIEALTAFKYYLTYDEKESRDAAERYARDERARSGVSLDPRA